MQQQAFWAPQGVNMQQAQQAATALAQQQQTRRALAQQRALAKLSAPANPPQTSGAAPFIDRHRAELQEHEQLYQRSEWMKELFCVSDERAPRGGAAEDTLREFASKEIDSNAAQEEIAAIRSAARSFEEVCATMRKCTAPQQLEALRNAQETARGERVHFRATMCLPLQAPRSGSVPRCRN